MVGIFRKKKRTKYKESFMQLDMCVSFVNAVYSSGFLWLQKGALKLERNQMVKMYDKSFVDLV